MDEHWNLVENKPYPLFEGVWEKRFILPETHTADFGNEIGGHLEIPFVGGGYLRLGRTQDAKPDVSVDIRFQTARGEMREEEFIVMSGTKLGKPYPFWIYYDQNSQDERMKFLARMNPEKDIDWEKIPPESKENEIAKALCKYKEVKTRTTNR